MHKVVLLFYMFTRSAVWPG